MICYSTGPSGDALVAMLRRWGIAETVQDRLVLASPGVPVGTLLGDGGGIGFQQTSELLGMPGVAIVGAVPSGLVPSTTFAAGISARSRLVPDAQDFISFTCFAAHSDMKRRAGFELVC